MQTEFARTISLTAVIALYAAYLASVFGVFIWRLRHKARSATAMQSTGPGATSFELRLSIPFVRLFTIAALPIVVVFALAVLGN
jgi:hypothetical protein